MYLFSIYIYITKYIGCIVGTKLRISGNNIFLNMIPSKSNKIIKDCYNRY